MNIESTPIPDLKVINPRVFDDDRGFFFESYNRKKFEELGLPTEWAQDNHAFSCKDTLRGLHFQTGKGQAKLVRVIEGRVWDVAVDIRPESPTFKQWFGLELTGENKKMFLIPEGFAHGYCVLSETSIFVYKCSTVYDGALETEIRWNEPEFGIEWPVATPLLSERDKQSQSLQEYLAKLDA